MITKLNNEFIYKLIILSFTVIPISSCSRKYDILVDYYNNKLEFTLYETGILGRKSISDSCIRYIRVSDISSGEIMWEIDSNYSPGCIHNKIEFGEIIQNVRIKHEKTALVAGHNCEVVMIARDGLSREEFSCLPRS